MRLGELIGARYQFSGLDYQPACACKVTLDVLCQRCSVLSSSQEIPVRRTIIAAMFAAGFVATPVLAETSQSTTDCDGDVCVFRFQFSDGTVQQTRCAGPSGHTTCQTISGYILGSDPIDPVWEAHKAEARRASGYRDPGAKSLCGAKQRMTSDGCK